MPHVLVTGGAGYVGSHTVRELLLHGYRVTIFDDFSTGHRAAVPPGVTVVEGTLADRAAIGRAFVTEGEKIDRVLHFAANTLVGESMVLPFKYLRDNVVGSLNLLEAALEHGVRNLVFSSTAHLFGVPERALIDETHPIMPATPYGESKSIFERMLHWTDKIHGMRYVCLRYFNAAGAHPDGTLGECHHPETHIVPIVLEAALGRRAEVIIYGDDYPTPDGSCVRDFVHVCDLARAHVLALGADHLPSGAYNLGSGTPCSVRELIDAARRVTGVDIKVRVGARRPGDPPTLVAGWERARRDLGWQPTMSDLDTVLGTAWAWHKSRPDGFGCAR